MLLSFQAVTIDTSAPDHDAMLVFRDGRLLAVLSCLSEIHDDLAGQWFIEAMFGEGPAAQPQAFKSLTLFEEWLAMA